MVAHLLYYQLALLALVWLFVMLHVAESRRGAPIPPTATPMKPKRKRSNAPKPFNGLTHKPHCALCARDTASPQAPPPIPPDPMAPTHRRPREVDTSRHFCPHAGCDYRGWLGLGNLRANGHPSGGPWRQFHCTACEGLLPGDARHALPRQTRSRRAHRARLGLPGRGLPTICQPPSVNFFTSFARLAHDESGSHHSRDAHGA